MLRRVLWLVVGLAALVGVAVWFVTSADPINPATFEQIKLGMTQAEVEAVIGKPPGKYWTGVSPDWRAPYGHSMVERGVTREEWWKDREKYESARWLGNAYSIHTVFDSEGKAAGCYLAELWPANPSIPDRIRAWVAGW